MRLNFYNPTTGHQTHGVYWFSWTSVFFGGFVPLFRGHWTGFLGQLLMLVCTLGASYFVMPLLYNKWHAEWLTKRGYVLLADDKTAQRVQKGWRNIAIKHSDQVGLVQGGKITL